MSGLEPQAVVHQDHVHAAGMVAEARDEEVAADGVLGLAVGARARLAARRVEVKALRVDGRGHVARTLDGAVQVAADLVHPHDEEHVARALRDGAHAVGVAVDVDDHAVVRDGVRARHEHVRVVGREHGRALVLHLVAVDEVVVSGGQGIGQADLARAGAPAHGDGRALADERERLLQRLLPGCRVLRLDVPPGKPLDDGLGQELVALGEVLIHTLPLTRAARNEGAPRFSPVTILRARRTARQRKQSRRPARRTPRSGGCARQEEC